MCGTDFIIYTAWQEKMIIRIMFVQVIMIHYEYVVDFVSCVFFLFCFIGRVEIQSNKRHVHKRA